MRPPMKKLFAPALIAISVASLNAQILTNFGEEAFNGGSWAYSPGTSTISGTDGFGDLIYGTPVSLDITGAVGFSLTANATTAPSGSFHIIVEDDEFLAISAIFFWSDFVGGATVQKSFATVDPGFDFANISGWTLVSGGSTQPIAITMNALSAIPEPATWVLIAAPLGAVMAFRRRRFAHGR